MDGSGAAPVTQQPTGFSDAQPTMQLTEFSNDAATSNHVLQPLASMDKVIVHQILNIAELVTGFSADNRYNLCTGQDQLFWTAQEDTDCCTRQVCGKNRPFIIHMHDLHNTPVMNIQRDLRMQGCPCCPQELYINSPPGNPIGRIREKPACSPKYEVYDQGNNLLYYITGPVCVCKCCDDIVFSITSPNGEDSGNITKHWGGCKEMMGHVNDFTVTFGPSESVLNKAILLGATFLIDFMFFEKK